MYKGVGIDDGGNNGEMERLEEKERAGVLSWGTYVRQPKGLSGHEDAVVRLAYERDCGPRCTERETRTKKKK